MAWQDRDYNRGREAMFSFLSSPGSILGLSVPLITRPGFYVRLHFWLLLWFVFDIISIVQTQSPLFFIPLDMALIIAILLIHEFGHRTMARMVGGDHWEFVLWPLGGMSPPRAPSTPWATFVAHSGGILF